MATAAAIAILPSTPILTKPPCPLLGPSPLLVGPGGLTLSSTTGTLGLSWGSSSTTSPPSSAPARAPLNLRRIHPIFPVVVAPAAPRNTADCSDTLTVGLALSSALGVGAAGVAVGV